MTTSRRRSGARWGRGQSDGQGAVRRRPGKAVLRLAARVTPRLRGRARVVAVNAAWTLVGLILVALAAEGWARAKVRFLPAESRPHYVHPVAGRIYVADSEFHHTNMLDYWNVARANQWGFLDRPPVLPENGQDGEPSCRVAVVGDSFVDAKELPVSDKLQVRLEEIARKRLPALRIAASAFGHSATGQINQLGYYDEFVSRTSPHVVVLVFVHNDFSDNFPPLHAVGSGYHADRSPWITAHRLDDGAFELLPPNLVGERIRLELGVLRPRPTLVRRIKRLAVSASYFAKIVEAKTARMSLKLYLDARREALARDPRYAPWLSEWGNYALHNIDFGTRDLPPAGSVALEYTGFALDQWKLRSERDGFVLAILSAHMMGTQGNLRFERLKGLASSRNIPVVDQHAYILRQGRRIRDAHWAHDAHWNARGHRWAAEALLEWLEANREACG